MAHFFHPANGAAISSLSYAPGQRVLVGLWGGGPGGEDLDVITDAHPTWPYMVPDPAVRQLRADRANWNFV